MVHWPASPQDEPSDAENVAMVCIDYKKAYDIDLQSWIVDCLKIYKQSNNLSNHEKRLTT